MTTTTLAARLERAIRVSVPAIVSVSIDDPANKATYKVIPASLQAAAQPTIDAFNVNDPAAVDADLDEQIKNALDNDRLISAVVWETIAAVNPPVTKAKYNAARSNIISHFKLQPWK